MTAPRARWVVAAGLALLAAGCGQTAAGPGADGTPTGGGDGWRPVAESPLSPREAPLAVAVGEKVLVIGGSDGPPCPPGASCVAGPEPLGDGAAYDPAADRWEPIADAPVPISAFPETTAVVGDTVYLLSTLWAADGTGTVTTSFLAYDAAADTWTTLTPPDRGDRSSLTVSGGRVVAYSTSHESGGETIEPVDPLPADLVYDAAAGTWSALPADPLGPSYDRRLIGTDDGAVLLASALVPDPGVDPPVVHAAKLDLATGAWSELPDGDLVSAFTMRRVGDLVLSAQEGSADGGEVNNWGRDIPYAAVLDPAAGVWSELPERAEREPGDGFSVPGEVSGERTIVSGAWVLDVPTLGWSRVPDLPFEEQIQGQSAAFAGTADGGGQVFLWGGAYWPDEDWAAEGELLADGWIWTVPAPE
ncbi:hypothetical protein E1212_21870 [Jiangella ureilytica]|uniref:Galactose oxidase n=1 Tax=Jiangella ureilytica TaxID=2530374 RepID=A0A4R4RG64_9ACTN|nr:hypothetical protein [Jiangella ureilytica]TDC48264.1 hypothetical protein E1212_21870 [Jiangella ureilytica]